jgi:hypothetical protein
MPDRAANGSRTVLAVARVVPLRTVNERLHGALAAICDVASSSPKPCMTERFSITVRKQFGGRLKAMNANPQQPGPPSGETETATIPKGQRILAMFLRALVFGALVAMTVHLSSPQSETIWTVYDTPGDLIRLALGFAVCLWIVIRFFRFPKTAEVYRAWVNFGLVVAPLALVTAIAIWLWI